MTPTEQEIEVADEAAARAVMAEREAIIAIIGDAGDGDYDTAADFTARALVEAIRARSTPVWPMRGK